MQDEKDLDAIRIKAREEWERKIPVGVTVALQQIWDDAWHAALRQAANGPLNTAEEKQAMEKVSSRFGAEGSPEKAIAADAFCAGVRWGCQAARPTELFGVQPHSSLNAACDVTIETMFKTMLEKRWPSEKEQKTECGPRWSAQWKCGFEHACRWLKFCLLRDVLDTNSSK